MCRLSLASCVLLLGPCLLQTAAGEERLSRPYNPTYPTTFFEIEMGGQGRPKPTDPEPVAWRQQRGLRALGALGGQVAAAAMLDVLGPTPTTAHA